MKNPAAGGGRWVDVSPERLVSWMVTFARRHGGGLVARGDADGLLTFTAADGATAECHPPFPRPPGHRDVERHRGARSGGGGGGDGSVCCGRPDRGRPAGAAGGLRGGRLRRFAASAGELEDRKQAGARSERGGRLVPASVRPPPGESGRDRAARGGGRRGGDIRPLRRRMGWTPWCSAGTSGRRPDCAATRGCRRIWTARWTGSSPSRPEAGCAQGGPARIRRDPHQADRARTRWPPAR